MAQRVDAWGRVWLPPPLRRELDLELDDVVCVEIEPSADRDAPAQIALSAERPLCVLCGQAQARLLFREQGVCRSCVAEIRRLYYGRA